nr:hypothetical protein 1634Bnrm1_p086 [Cryptomonas sp.]
MEKNKALFYKFEENKNIIISGITMSQTNLHVKKNSFINVFLNLGFNSRTFKSSEKLLEKEIYCQLNRVIWNSFPKHIENSSFINIYLVVIKNKGNLILNCINCVLLNFIRTEFRIKDFFFNKSFYFLKNSNILMFGVFEKIEELHSACKIIIFQAPYSKIIFKILTNGLVSKNLLIYVSLFFLNFKMLVKLNKLKY